MERMTMEQALSRQQIAMIREWDAYQASLLGKEGRQALTRARDGGRKEEETPLPVAGPGKR